MTFQTDAFQNDAFQVDLPTPEVVRRKIVGWYTTAKGSFYYYEDPDGQPGPRPPVGN